MANSGTYFPSSPRSPRRPVVDVLLAFLLLVFLLVCGGLLLWWLWPGRETGRDLQAVSRLVTPRGELASDEQTTIAIYEQAAPSVVHVTRLAVQRDLLGLDVQQIPEGTGSGIVWDKKGHILTNHHVVQGADSATVTLADRSTWPARLVGSDPATDLAVLSIRAPGSKLTPVLVGSSGDLQVGQKAFAIGNPFGLDQTLTTGIVSALGREIESAAAGRKIRQVIQIDAAINPGNSGGPLLDSAGRLIGVNTAIFSPSGTWAGIGFAIPVDEVNRVVPQLIQHGRVVRPALGVVVGPEQWLHRRGMKGVLIVEVLPGSAAERAGLRPTRRAAEGRLILGDIIVALDDQPITAINDLYAILERHKVGDTVTVTVVRDGEQEQVPLTLQEAR